MTLSATAVERFDELAGSVAHPAVVAHLRQLIDGGGDVDCYKVNAFRIAEEVGVPRPDAVRALLFATRLGLFDLHWDVHCPSCKGVPEYHRHLMALQTRAHCRLCEIDWALDFSEQIEVTFTVNADVRAIKVREFDDYQFPEVMDWFAAIVGREGRTPVVGAVLQPGEARRLVGVAEAGDLIALVPSHLEGAARLAVSGAPVTGEQVIDVQVGRDGTVMVRPTELAPGPVAFDVHYGYGKPWGFGVRAIAPQRNWVSATYLTSQQDFRDLFNGEFLAPEASFAVRSLTFLFTDIKGSTEMYEALGDAGAYAIVQQHFRVMSEVIRRHEGGIVKTIGDAVMAVFPVNADGVRAACEIQRTFGASADPLRKVEVKIGLHRGPAIAVTSNRAVDYFGRTVNVAARAEGQARPREVLVTAAVLGDPAVRAHLDASGLTTTAFTAEVKGVAQPIELHSIKL